MVANKAALAKLLTPVAQQPSELFLVRPEGAKGSLIAYDIADGQPYFSLPPGMLAADGQHYYAASSQQNITTLKAYNLATGDQQSHFTLRGSWKLQGLSASGRWLALERVIDPLQKQMWIMSNRWQTEIKIVDANDGHVAHTLLLDGNFEVETIATTGDALFLIQHLPAINPDHYLVRLYDLGADELQSDALRDKRVQDEFMAGLAWNGVASPDGQWLLTLYLSTLRNVAFIHALNLPGRYPVCIDLPSGNGDFEQLKYYTLTLAPNGRTVYATNAALGVVAQVNLEQFKVVQVTEFSFESVSDTRVAMPIAQSVLSEDGFRLFFTDGYQVWSYTTESGEVASLFSSEQPIAGLGLSSDGQQLYIADTNQAMTIFELPR